MEVDRLIWFFCLPRSIPSLCILALKYSGGGQDRCGPILSLDAPSGFRKVLRIGFAHLFQVLTADESGGMKFPVYLPAARPARGTRSRLVQ